MEKCMKFIFSFTIYSILLFVAIQVKAETGPLSPIALTISGGISLGSYESGANWTIIEYFKNKIKNNSVKSYSNPDLVAITGASAGSINAAMSAITWCMKKPASMPAKNTIDDNILKNTWFNVGIDELLPDKDLDYSDGQGMTTDALFSRKKAYEKSIQEFKNLVGQRVFREEECRVPLGMLTTREIPPEIAVNNVRVKNQRFVFALEFYSNDGWGHFRTVPKDEENPDLGNVVYPHGRCDDVGHDATGGKWHVHN